MIICVKSVGDGLSPVFGTAVSISLGMNVVDGTATGVAAVGKEVAVEGEDRLAVATCGEGVGVGILGAYVLVVVYLTIDGEYLLAIAAEQRLATGLGVDDRQAFMGEDGGVTCIDTAPVGATVSYLLTHTQCFVTELAHRAANVENGYNSTHIIYIYKVGCLWTIAGVSSSDAVIL